MRKLTSNSGVKRFACGFICAVIMLSFATAAMAASGQISFNTISFNINGLNIAEKGEYIIANSGAKIPSVIAYEDETGGVTNYIPVRLVAQQLDLPLSWDGNSFNLGMDARQALQPTLMEDGSLNWDNQLLELKEAILPPDNASELMHAELTGRHNAIIEPSEDCKYLTLTVINKGDSDISFSLGAATSDGRSSGVTTSIVRAGETSVRTIEILTELDEIFPYIDIYNNGGELSVSVSAMQF